MFAILYKYTGLLHATHHAVGLKAQSWSKNTAACMYLVLMFTHSEI